MSVKSKKTTADRSSRNEKETKYISHSATKMVNRLSLSFYGEDTLKMHKQVILDTYDNFDSDSQSHSTRIAPKPASCPKNKVAKPKTPVIRYLKPDDKHAPAPRNAKPRPAEQTEDRRPGGKPRDRSSSKSSRGKKVGNPLLNYLSNRIDITAKGWTALRPLLQDKNSHNKRL